MIPYRGGLPDAPSIVIHRASHNVAHNQDQIRRGEMRSEEDLLESATIVLKKQQGWSDPITFEECTTGATNRSYKVESSGRRAFLRLLKTPMPPGVDRVAERVAFSSAADAGIAPPILYQDSAMLLTGYLEGVNLIPVEDKELSLVVALARSVHALPPLPRDFDPWEVAIRQLGELRIPVTTLEAPVRRFLEERKAIEGALDLLPRTPSHNDFHGGNIMKVAGTLYLVDWEYGGTCYETYDLARFATFHQVSTGKCRELLTMYYLRLPSREEERGFFLLYSLSVFSSIVWLRARIEEGHPMRGEFERRLPGRVELLGTLVREFL